MHEIKVSRTSFFQSPTGGTLAYSEHSPEQPEEHEHQVCNCTKVVNTRPEGEPYQTRLDIEAHTQTQGLNAEFNLTNLCFTLRWGEANERGYQDDHSRFGFHPEQHSAQIEICIPGYDPIPGYKKPLNYFITNLYLGNQIDISHFFNGHSPSRIVDLSRLQPNTLWVHKNFFPERMAILPNTDEASSWRKCFDLIQVLHKRTHQHKAASDNLDHIRKLVSEDLNILFTLDYITEWLVHITKNIKDTDLFLVGRNLDFTEETNQV